MEQINYSFIFILLIKNVIRIKSIDSNFGKNIYRCNNQFCIPMSTMARHCIFYANLSISTWTIWNITLLEILIKLENLVMLSDATNFHIPSVFLSLMFMKKFEKNLKSETKEKFIIDLDRFGLVAALTSKFLAL